MHKLPGDLYKELLDAFLSAFPTYDKLEQMVRIRLNENLASLVGGGTQTDMVFRLIGWAEANGKLITLIEGARKSNSGNPALIEFEKKYKGLEYEKLTVHEDNSAKKLKDNLSVDNIQSVSLILDDSTSLSGTKCIIGGRRIYLDSRLENASETEKEKAFGHLNVYFPIQDFNVTENILVEDEIFVCGLAGYIANHSRILRFSIERFGVIPAILKNFHYLEELRILECKNIKSIPWDIGYLTKLEKLIIQETSIDTFPVPILELPNLTHLDLSGNQLRSVPSGINRLTKLSTLSLMNNPLENLPRELNELKNLQSFFVEDRLKKTFGIVVGDVNGRGLEATKKEMKNSNESRLTGITNWIFLTFPEIVGRLFLDIFGQHDPARSSSIILGWVIIILIVLILSGFVEWNWLVNAIENIRHFFSPVK
ncbi:MAG: effector-associated domain EAD1-containing protein [Anaerolineales bacterium]|nr:MAG: effector-associated domain EAD1-containing protein [Anaerolineales bacterium]